MEHRHTVKGRLQSSSVRGTFLADSTTTRSTLNSKSHLTFSSSNSRLPHHRGTSMARQTVATTFTRCMNRPREQETSSASLEVGALGRL